MAIALKGDCGNRAFWQLPSGWKLASFGLNWHAEPEVRFSLAPQKPSPAINDLQLLDGLLMSYLKIKCATVHSAFKAWEPKHALRSAQQPLASSKLPQMRHCGDCQQCSATTTVVHRCLPMKWFARAKCIRNLGRSVDKDRAHYLTLRLAL